MPQEIKSEPKVLIEVLREELNHIKGKPVIDHKFVADKDLKPVFEIMHGEKLSAVCFSGGGIRSATFGLGIVQALAKYNLLNKFDYLSTVSGGGYLGCWLSAWTKRKQDELTEAKVGNLVVDGNLYTMLMQSVKKLQLSALMIFNVGLINPINLKTANRIRNRRKLQGCVNSAII
jgi:Patatin-like phospholipase